jgi:hypothetical protein
MDYYKLWLELKKKSNNDNIRKKFYSKSFFKSLQNNVNNDNYEHNEHNEKIINNLLFSYFCNKYCIAGNNINDCILLNFPLEVIIPFLEEFTKKYDKMNIDVDGCIQLTKLIYHLWPKYMYQSLFNYNKHYPHGSIFELLNVIKFKLEKFNKIKSYKEHIEKLKSNYYEWHLLGCIPLLKNGEEIMKKVVCLSYDDAQEMILFGLSQFDAVKYLPTLGKILLNWNDNFHFYPEFDRNHSYCNSIKIEGGTGIYGDLINLAYEYKSKGVDIYSNKDIDSVLKINLFNYKEKKLSFNDYDEFLKISL